VSRLVEPQARAVSPSQAREGERPGTRPDFRWRVAPPDEFRREEVPECVNTGAKLGLRLSRTEALAPQQLPVHRRAIAFPSCSPGPLDAGQTSRPRGKTLRDSSRCSCLTRWSEARAGRCEGIHRHETLDQKNLRRALPRHRIPRFERPHPHAAGSLEIGFDRSPQFYNWRHPGAPRRTVLARKPPTENFEEGRNPKAVHLRNTGGRALAG
jgi:hypothetical protein